MIIGAGVSRQTVDDPVITWHGLLETASNSGQLRTSRFAERNPTQQHAGLINQHLALGTPVLTMNYDTLVEDATGAA